MELPAFLTNMDIKFTNEDLEPTKIKIVFDMSTHYNLRVPDIFL